MTNLIQHREKGEIKSGTILVRYTYQVQEVSLTSNNRYMVKFLIDLNSNVNGFIDNVWEKRYYVSIKANTTSEAIEKAVEKMFKNFGEADNHNSISFCRRIREIFGAVKIVFYGVLFIALLILLTHNC